ncbi:type II secretion system F family protein [Boseongicola aestuarii]|uniref:Bacterial type II secretion system protein F domain protein n=1 Tax=Boseongicola aestuarii TaxID=1470561 RepID=A0A238IVK0_9RHOB|nr:type II secretion system F family protein [Boseongicola aestuarii]SMX22051.1 Bacterial type II secretion system protein F domain protein [Boseongicola aestuarii]
MEQIREFIAQIDAQFVVYLGAVIGGLLVLEGLRQLFSRSAGAEEAKSKRMQMIAKGATTEQILKVLKPTEKRSFVERLPFVGDLPTVLRQAGITMAPGAFLATCFAAAVAITIIAFQFMNALNAVVLGFIVGLFLPIMQVRLKRNERLGKLVHQMPDALDLMARGLLVGHPLNTSLNAVANEMPDPVGSEFGVVVDQVAFGDELTEAFRDFAERIDQEDVHYLATAIAIQHGTGGDLARVLKVLSRTIRDRITMRKRIKALSAEGRLTAAFLSFIPVLIFVVMQILTPSYYGSIASEPEAVPLGFAIVTLTILNALAMRKLVNFRF